MVSICDLNDDCLAEVLEYLPSPLLIACISSLHLKNEQFRRCALDALKKSYGPFSLMSKFTRAEIPLSRFTSLQDSKRTELCELKPPYKFAASSLADSVESAEIPVFYNYAGGDLDARLEIVKSLPNVKSLAIRVLVHSGSRLSFGSSFSKFAAKLGLVFPNLRSFAVVGPAILPNQGINAVIEMINQMPHAISLKLPSYLLGPFLARLPAKANELSELVLYRNHNDKSGVSCATIISDVGAARLGELSHLDFSCRHEHEGERFIYWSIDRHDCIQAFTPLQKLPKLNALTLDIDLTLANWNTSPAPISADGFISLSELNVTLRQGYNDRSASAWTHSLFSQLADVRTLRFGVTQFDAEFFNIVQSAICSHSKLSSSIREFRFDGGLSPPHRWASSWPVRAVRAAFQAPVLCHLSKLERLIVTGASVDLSGFASEKRGLNSNGYPSIAEIIRGLKSCRSLKYAKMRASVDSPEALKVWLPDNCEIIDVIAKPREGRKDCFVLHPDKYWRPVEILFSAEKDAVSPINETAKFALCIIVPQSEFT